MRREAIEAEHIDEVLKIFAVALLNPDTVAEFENTPEEYPFVYRMLMRNPEEVLAVFRNGSLMHDLPDKILHAWKWDVRVTEDNLHIAFRPNKPLDEYTEIDEKNMAVINARVAEYLATLG